MDGAPPATMIAPSGIAAGIAAAFNLSIASNNQSTAAAADFAATASNKFPGTLDVSSPPVNVVVDWDEWDSALWTPEQRRQIESEAVPRQVLVLLGLVLFAVVIFGLAANATILYVFSRFKRLRTPANVFIINLTICDLVSCLIHPLAVYSAFRGRWSFGKTGCNLYGMGVGFFGLNSIVTLSAIACERYVVITSSSCRSVVARWRITRTQARKICAGIWFHCAALVTPPWLLSWSSYQPEGALVSCSWDYTTRTLSNRLYYVYLLVMGFVIPVGVLTFCYSAIFRFIVRSSKEMTRLIMTSDGRSTLSKTTISFRNKRRQTDVRTALIILSLALACFTAWTPYAVVSLVGQFAPLDPDEAVRHMSPLLTTIPAFFAKTAIVFNPLVYGFSHPQFRSSVRQMLNQYSVESSVNGPRLPHNDTMTMTMNGGRHRLLLRRHKNRLAMLSGHQRGGQGSVVIGSSSPSGNKRSDEPANQSADPANVRSGNLFRQPTEVVRLVHGKRNGTRLMVMKESACGIDSRMESVHCSPSNSDAEDADDERKSNASSSSGGDSAASIRRHRQHQQPFSTTGKHEQQQKICAPVQPTDPDPVRRRASAPDLLLPTLNVVEFDVDSNGDAATTQLLFRSSGNLPKAAPAGSAAGSTRAYTDSEQPTKPDVLQRKAGFLLPVDSASCVRFEWVGLNGLSCPLVNS